MTRAGAFEPDLTLWDAWRPADVARRFAGVQAPWYVAAGWAIDLFLGEQTREHGDLEIGIPRARFAELASLLSGFEFFIPVSGPGDGMVWPLDQAGEFLQEHHQTWVREPETGLWRLDIFREPSDNDTWIFRRDERIRLSFRELILHTEVGIPYARPDVALLFKAKWSDLAKNQQDFAAVLPRLGPARRRWLKDALELVHPEHEWIPELT